MDTCTLGGKQEQCTKPSLAAIFLLFLKIGTVGFGGGPALISIIQQEVVDKKQWITSELYLQGLAISLVPPGSMMVNIAFFVGGLLRGFAGSLLAILGILLPSFFMMVILAAVLTFYRSLNLDTGAVRGLVPAVTGVLIAMAIHMTREHVRTLPGYLLMLGSALLMYVFGVPPYLIVFGALLLGGILWVRKQQQPVPAAPLPPEKKEETCTAVEPASGAGPQDVIPPVYEKPCNGGDRQ